MFANVVVIAILYGLLLRADCHDICIDGSPPNNYRNVEFNICGKYRHNGCCDKEVEQRIFDQYSEVVTSRGIDKSCSSLLSEIFCQECSPKSGHLYEGGKLTDKRKFPSICPNFCSKLHDQCRDHIEAIFGEQVCHPHASDTIINCYPRTDRMDESHDGSDMPSEECIPICLEIVLDGVKNIVDSAFPPDGSNRLFLVQQDGIIYELDAKRKKMDQPFLDLSGNIEFREGVDERGLLSMVFDPDFANNQRIYLFYTPSGPIIKPRIVRMKVWDTGSPMKVNPDTEEILLEFEKFEHNHNGGQLFFGNDGYLYISTGDGGGSGDRHGKRGNGQLLTTYLGKILRIDVSGETGYKIPDDNPFARSTDELKEIFAYGLRNPWRVSIDRVSGTIFAGDVGQQRIEEVNIIENGGNYGWRAYEGKECYDKEQCEELLRKGTEIKKPIYFYNHTKGESVIGGYVYRGASMSRLRGMYVFGDLRHSQLWALEKSGDKWDKRDICVRKMKCPSTAEEKNPRKKLLGFGEDAEGEIYVFVATTVKGYLSDGTVYKVISPINES